MKNGSVTLHNILVVIPSVCGCHPSPQQFIFPAGELHKSISASETTRGTRGNLQGVITATCM